MLHEERMRPVRGFPWLGSVHCISFSATMQLSSSVSPDCTDAIEILYY